METQALRINAFLSGVWAMLTEIKATCPTHGIQIFRRVEDACLYVCVGWMSDPTNPCPSIITDESMTPDGAPVQDLQVWRKQSDSHEVRVWNTFTVTDGWMGHLNGFGWSNTETTQTRVTWGLRDGWGHLNQRKIWQEGT